MPEKSRIRGFAWYLRQRGALVNCQDFWLCGCRSATR
jgi:hypothetical protein